jgi:hypothetical protein
VEEEPRVLRTFATPTEACIWAAKWFADRGIGFLCDVDRHERDGNTFVVLHACPLLYIGAGRPGWLDEFTDTVRDWPFGCTRHPGACSSRIDPQAAHGA